MSEQLVPLGPDAPLNWVTEQDAERLGFHPWDPKAWEAHGWARGFGDAAVMSPYFEVLARRDSDGREVEYVVLCPTFLRRPLVFTARGEDLETSAAY